MLSQTAYGKYAGLSQQRISQLVREGLPTIEGKIDPAVADAWIARNLDPLKRAVAKAAPVPKPQRLAPRRPEEPAERAAPQKRSSIAAARTEKLEADASLARLKLREREGSLVARDAAERFVFEKAREQRDGWITWVARSAPVLAHELEADPQRTFATLDRLARAFLREQAGEDGEE
jgi:hypothetical protein